jgi:high affinity Mn2+ porin
MQTYKKLLVAVGAGLAPFAATCPALADQTAAPETWSLHSQLTFTEQYHPAFRALFSGANSLDPGSRGWETADLTLFAGVRLADETEFYVNPEVDQGFGLSGTFGLAAFSSGEAYKVGKANPYMRFQRVFLRQTFDLGGDVQEIAPDANQLGGEKTADNIVVTIGKFSVTDIFDNNAFAHDPRADFLNWAVIDDGAFDYAADSWAYTYGATTEWNQSWWTLRAGLFDLSTVPNTTVLDTGFEQFAIIAEGEERHSLWGKDGKLKLLAFLNRAHMGSYRDAVALGVATDTIPDTAHVRKYASRPGIGLNFEQAVYDDLGVFARASLNDGGKETYEFTEINNSVALGLALQGTDWARPNDTVGLAAENAGISKAAQSYFAAGGLGTLIGDGALVHYGRERIVELYYKLQATTWLNATADYQFVQDPAYNRDRGPVSILGFRLHAQY